MSYALARTIERFGQQDVARMTSSRAAVGHSVVIRPARDADLPLLRDLAELDSAVPLRGSVLVAVVDGEIWAARGIDDGRAIADPFRPSGPAAALLAMRVRQLRTADVGAPRASRLLRRLAGRAVW